VAELRAKRERLDRSTALRRLLWEGAERYVLDLLSAGHISLSRAAQLLECSTLEVQDLLRDRQLRAGGDAEDLKGARTLVPSPGIRRP
jgi:predicted HTH domain antitoxin